MRFPGLRPSRLPEVVRPWPALIEGPSGAALLREVRRATAAGELAACGPLRQLPTGRWAVQVLRLRPPAAPQPSWRRPALVACSVLLVLAGAAGLGWTLVGAVPAGLAYGLLGAVAVGAVLAAALLRPASHGCTTTVTITHKCR